MRELYWVAEKEHTPETALLRMVELRDMGEGVALQDLGMERRHIEADEILCAILRTHGYHELVAAYDEFYKWHA